jgi:hypothetical protein
MEYSWHRLGGIKNTQEKLDMLLHEARHELRARGITICKDRLMDFVYDVDENILSYCYRHRNTIEFRLRQDDTDRSSDTHKRQYRRRFIKAKTRRYR